MSKKKSDLERAIEALPEAAEAAHEARLDALADALAKQGWTRIRSVLAALDREDLLADDAMLEHVIARLDPPTQTPA